MDKVLEKLKLFLVDEEEVLKDFAVDLTEASLGGYISKNIQQDYIEQRGRIAAITDAIEIMEDLKFD